MPAGCSSAGCGKPHRARGLCSTHYNQQQPARFKYVQKPCASCAAPVTKQATSRRAVCSLPCRHWLQWGRWPASAVPTSHPSRYVPPRPRVLSPLPPPSTRSCLWCGQGYSTRCAEQVYCTGRCKKRHGNARRRGQSAGSPVSYTWTEVIRVFLTFDRCCAYCEQPIEGQPDPDHVVPLSKGGSNGISNILPACRLCNSDKRELSLADWNVDRARRGLPPRTVAWSMTDPRVVHLAPALRDAA